MKQASILLTTVVVCAALVGAWPDGAPCTHAAVENMNPLEAVEHQGGLQLSIPPFYIQNDIKCYWRNQPVEVILRGNSTHDVFKGFAIQPFIYDGPRRGQRLGQFLRLDDNGSWQQQCFQRKDSATHSHDMPRGSLDLWWSSDTDDDVVQFVATVVVSVHKFWVKSVLSAPLPPCRLRSDMAGWQRPAISAPPPVSNFKIYTFQLFNKDQSLSNLPDHLKSRAFISPPVHNSRQLQSSSPSEQTFMPVVQTSTPVTTIATRRLDHVIPISDMETNRRPNQLLQQQQQQTFIPQTVSEQTTIISPLQQQFRQQNAFQRFQQQQSLQQQFQRQKSRVSIIQTNGSCQDIGSSQQCASWRPFCPRNEYMRVFCKRTCNFC